MLSSDRSYMFVSTVGFHGFLSNSMPAIRHSDSAWGGLSGAAGRGVDRDHPLPGIRRGRSKLTNNEVHEMTFLRTVIKIIFFQEAGEGRV